MLRRTSSQRAGDRARRPGKAPSTPAGFAERGLTLIEVMVALIVISLALTAAMVSIGQVTSSAKSMRDRTYASWIGQNRLAEYRLAGELPETGRSDGEIEYAGVDWAWEADISETGVDNLLRIDVSVSAPGAEDSVWTVTGFIGEPTIPGQANRAWASNARDRGDRS
ncbi:MAG: type II secretion system minor pseudopilin GspI [Pseudomonadota bacterium]